MNFRCKNKCNIAHIGCKRGILPEDFFYCSTASTALADTTLNFVKYEASDVKTFGMALEKLTQEWRSLNWS